MDLTDVQWDAIKGCFPAEELKPPGRKGGRPWRSARTVLDGILWVLRTGAPWADLPTRYPPYQTGHRRFQCWIEKGVFVKILEGLWMDLKERGRLDSIESFIDGSYVPAKRGAHALVGRVPGRQPRSWLSQTAMVFHSLSVLMEETDTTLFSPIKRSTLRSWMSSRES